MENITLLTPIELAKITNHRSGEIKFGEKINTVPKGADVIEFMVSCDANQPVNTKKHLPGDVFT